MPSGSGRCIKAGGRDDQICALLPLKAKPGKEKEVADFLRSAVPLALPKPDHSAVKGESAAAVSSRANGWASTAGTNDRW
jgi:hypothetical protein